MTPAVVSELPEDEVLAFLVEEEDPTEHCCGGKGGERGGAIGGTGKLRGKLVKKILGFTLIMGVMRYR